MSAIRLVFVCLLALLIATPVGANEPENVPSLQDARFPRDIEEYMRYEIGKIDPNADEKQRYFARADICMAAYERALELDNPFWAYVYRNRALRYRAIAEAGVEGADQRLETILNELAARDGYHGSVEARYMDYYRFNLVAARAKRTVKTPEDFETFKAELIPWISRKVERVSIPWTGFEVATQSGVSFDQFADEWIKYVQSTECTLSAREKDEAVKAITSSQQGYASWLFTESTNFKSSLAFLENPLPLADSTATTEEEMKPYTEKITGTELTFKMVPIPGGKFMMGSPEDETGRRADEGPRHEVEIKPFWMGEHEVTWKEFEQFALKYLRRNRTAEPTARERIADAIAAPTNPWEIGKISHDNAGKPGYPASGMKIYAAQVYCKWLTALTGRYYRLPTEAEWEYACRAGSDTAYSFGNDAKNIDDYAWHHGNSGGRSQMVKQKLPNAWGLYDMHGNVAEWVLEQYAIDTYAHRHPGTFGAPVRPTITRIGNNYSGHIARGGHCENDDMSDLRSARRLYSVQQWDALEVGFPYSIWWWTSAPYVGFRVVRPLEPPKPHEAAQLYEPDPQVWRDYFERSGR